MDRYNGILPIRKESGMTSHDVIYHLRKIIGQQKIGHTGTLDPLAVGLLVTVLGRATKITQFLTEWDKEYVAEITLGAVSDTLDAGGKITPGEEPPVLSNNDIESILEKFRGEISQQVPAYSAVKVKGRELYKYARSGMAGEAPIKRVEIKCLELLSYHSPKMTLRAFCSKGTYIRALAHDIGKAIGCGGYLSGLERTQSGPFQVHTALSLREVEARHATGELISNVFPIEEALQFPVVKVKNQVGERVRFGEMPKAADIIERRGDIRSGDLFSMADEQGAILAIGKAKIDGSGIEQQSNGDFFSYVRVLI